MGTYEVRNKLGVPPSLVDGLGDEVQIPELSTHRVDAKFIDFQLPPLAHAEVIGYDYAAHFAPKVEDELAKVPYKPTVLTPPTPRDQ